MRLAPLSIAFLLAGLLALVGCTATDRDPSDVSAAGSDSTAQGLVVHRSAYSADSTLARLVRTITSTPHLSVMAQVDHAANAARVDRPLPPTYVVIFGNPTLGTPLMQNQRTVAIDLPQKMLIWEDADGTVRIAYNAPDGLRARHRLTGQEDLLETISDALNTLATTAAGR